MSEVRALVQDSINGLQLEECVEIKMPLPRAEIIKQRYLFEQLTKKEKEVLFLIHKDLPQSKISAQLGMALNTYKTHRKRIYSKLKFENKSALIIWGNLFLTEFFGNL